MRNVYVLWQREHDGSGSKILRVFESQVDAEDAKALINSCYSPVEILVSEARLVHPVELGDIVG